MHCLRTMEKTLANLLRSSIFLLLLQIDVSFAQSFSGNIALNKSATQSNTFGSRVARYAVDGDRDTSNVDKCATAANANGQYNWWQVDLGDIYVVTSITLYISTSSQDGTYLQNSDVFVGNNNVDVTSQPKCWSFGVTTGISLGGSRTFNCSNLVVGRHITVRKNVMNDALTICEFMAAGNVIESTVSATSTATKTTPTSLVTSTTTVDSRSPSATLNLTTTSFFSSPSTASVTSNSGCFCPSMVCEPSDRTSAIIVGVILGCVLLVSLVLNVILLISRRRSMQSQVNMQSTLSTSSASEMKGYSEKLSSKSSDHKVPKPVIESAYADVGAEPGSPYAQLSERPSGNTHTYTTLQ